jgi:hypothetical protein
MTDVFLFHRPVRTLCVWTPSLTCRPCRPWDLWVDLARLVRLACPPWDLVPLAPPVFPPLAKERPSMAIASLVRFTLSTKDRAFLIPKVQHSEPYSLHVPFI